MPKAPISGPGGHLEGGISGEAVQAVIGDCTDYRLSWHFRGFEPEAVIHYAEQPSALTR